jgi:hypothetical protein
MYRPRKIKAFLSTVSSNKNPESRQTDYFAFPVFQHAIKTDLINLKK